ncbi:MAG: carbon-nitrogen hydrolase family protein [Thermodesulfobacteriota bacterium]
MNTKEYLHLALNHLAVRHKDPDYNRKNLLEMNEKAAASGADIIVNTEMAVSGYSFQSREDVRAFTETTREQTVPALMRIARKYHAYICVGLAEREEDTEIFYNSALVIGPQGDIVCRYRKINAEWRWCCPGQPQQDNTFATPWGKVGVLICSDTYYGLLPRTTALRGAHLLLVPANWPPIGLNPLEIWRARALENEIYLAACNRGRQDLRMSCEEAPSCLIDPQGRELLSISSADSQIHRVAIALNYGKLTNVSGRSFRKSRMVRDYGNIYLDMRLINDLTSHYEMPSPGKLHIICLTTDNDGCLPPDEILNLIDKLKIAGHNVFILPENDGNAELYKETAIVKQVAIIAANAKNRTICFATPEQVFQYDDCHGHCLKVMDYGPARIAICSPKSLYHPEMAVHLAKSGCDLAAVSGAIIDEPQHLLLGVKSLESIAIAVAAQDRGFICTPPEGHQRWREEKVIGQGACHMTLDTHTTRRKRFQDRVDFELLLRR